MELEEGRGEEETGCVRALSLWLVKVSKGYNMDTLWKSIQGFNDIVYHL